MKLPSLWSSSQNLMSDPYRSIRREMEDMFRTFDRHLPSLRVDRNWRLAPVRCEAAVRPKAGPKQKCLSHARIDNSRHSEILVQRRSYSAPYRALPSHACAGPLVLFTSDVLLRLSINSSSRAASASPR